MRIEMIFMRLRRATNKLKHSLLTVFFVILITGYGITTWAWQISKANIDESIADRNSQNVNGLGDSLDKRLSSYQEILRGTGALFAARQGQVSRDEWKNFTSSYELGERYKGVSSIGYLQLVEKNNLSTHLDYVRSTGLPNYAISPAGDRDNYAPAVYVEPSNDQTLFGFDMLTEPYRKEAMDKARDQGTAVASSVLKLKLTNSTGFLLFYPIYHGPSTSLEERRANIAGFSYAGVRVEELFQTISDTDHPLNDAPFAVMQGVEPNSDYIFRSRSFVSTQSMHRQTVNAFGNTWTIETSLSDSVLSSQERDQPRIILTAGFFMATLFALFVVYVSQSRSREYNYRRQLELQDAKDELLSLASHQLRTPATGVKQYVGMILQGYAGKVPAKQKDILERAYASNERQLNIVNQILHIARIESGRLPLYMSELNVVSLIQEVVSDQKSELTGRKQKLKLIFKRKRVMVTADSQYLRMVIENLISNASKYTRSGGSIAIEAYSDDENVVIEVSDTGVGIATEDFQKLFQKFSRIHNELSISSGGTGIGLYLTKLIVELHHGTIEVISRPDIGTTFRVTLPKNAEL